MPAEIATALPVLCSTEHEADPLGLADERTLYFTPTRLSEVQKAAAVSGRPRASGRMRLAAKEEITVAT